MFHFGRIKNIVLNVAVFIFSVCLFLSLVFYFRLSEHLYLPPVAGAHVPHVIMQQPVAGARVPRVIMPTAPSDMAS